MKGKYLWDVLIGAFFHILALSCSNHECPPIPDANIDTNSLRAGLVGHYPFTGNADDSSGYGNDGIVYGAELTEDRFGKASRAYLFDNTDSINISPDRFLNNTYTYCAWVKVIKLPADGSASQIISIGARGGDQTLGLVNNYYNNWGFTIGSYVNISTVDFISSGTLPSTQAWYHLAGTRDGSLLKLFVNGELKGTVTLSGPATYYGGSVTAANIGTRSHDNIHHFYGSIDDVRIYNRALSAEEILKLYQLDQ